MTSPPQISPLYLDKQIVVTLWVKVSFFNALGE